MHQGQAGRRADRLTEAPRRALALYGIAASVYLLDRATKHLAARGLGDGPLEVIPGVLDFRLTTNPGGAFGLLGGIPWVFVAISAMVVIVIVFSSRRLPSAGNAIGLGLVLGGALGNLTDRAFRGPGFSGEVVDFVDLQVWPIFNLADSGIVVGATLLLLVAIRHDREERAEREGRR